MAKKKVSSSAGSTRTSKKISSKRHGAAKKKWVKNVTTESTFPPHDTFKKDAKTIARVLGSKKVSPKGIGSGIRMIQYFINRGGKGLSATRKQELERAKHLLQKRLQHQNAKSK